MEELTEILRDHARRYPKMEPTDAVKLIYQNEFGGGHLIRDGEAVLRYLRAEYNTVSHNPAARREESIGNGIVRVHLAALTPEEVEELGRAFLHSAAIHQGSRPRFLEKLAVLERLAGEGIFGFSPEALEAYLQGYRDAGYPMVSHSQAYREAYHPAYRIIRK